jgi:hypothetical protein
MCHLLSFGPPCASIPQITTNSSSENRPRQRFPFFNKYTTAAACPCYPALLAAGSSPRSTPNCPLLSRRLGSRGDGTSARGGDCGFVPFLYEHVSPPLPSAGLARPWRRPPDPVLLFLYSTVCLSHHLGMMDGEQLSHRVPSLWKDQLQPNPAGNMCRSAFAFCTKSLISPSSASAGLVHSALPFRLD